MAEKWISPECIQNRHNECSDPSDPKICYCNCHDPIRPKIDLDKERTDIPVKVDRVSGLT